MDITTFGSSCTVFVTPHFRYTGWRTLQHPAVDERRFCASESSRHRLERSHGAAGEGIGPEKRQLLGNAEELPAGQQPVSTLQEPEQVSHRERQQDRLHLTHRLPLLLHVSEPSLLGRLSLLFLNLRSATLLMWLSLLFLNATLSTLRRTGALEAAEKHVHGLTRTGGLTDVIEYYVTERSDKRDMSLSHCGVPRTWRRRLVTFCPCQCRHGNACFDDTRLRCMLIRTSNMCQLPLYKIIILNVLECIQTVIEFQKPILECMETVLECQETLLECQSIVLE